MEEATTMRRPTTPTMPLTLPQGVILALQGDRDLRFRGSDLLAEYHPDMPYLGVSKDVFTTFWQARGVRALAGLAQQCYRCPLAMALQTLTGRYIVVDRKYIHDHDTQETWRTDPWMTAFIGGVDTPRDRGQRLTCKAALNIANTITVEA